MKTHELLESFLPVKAASYMLGKALSNLARQPSGFTMYLFPEVQEDAVAQLFFTRDEDAETFAQELERSGIETYYEPNNAPGEVHIQGDELLVPAAIARGLDLEWLTAQVRAGRATIFHPLRPSFTTPAMVWSQPPGQVSEALDRQPFTIDRANARLFRAISQVGSIDLRFTAGLDQDHGWWTITFETRGSSTRPWTTSLSGGGEAFKVLGAVSACLEAFIQQYAPSYLAFTADRDSQSRVRVYKRLIARFPEYQLEKTSQLDLGDGDMGQLLVYARG